jgi:hypothetical protein
MALTMKARFFAMSLLASAALSGCGSESVESSGKTGTRAAIAFSAPRTRANPISDAAGVAARGGFNVWAYNHAEAWNPSAPGTPLFSGATVTSPDGVSWTYGVPMTWPGGYSSFFAYAPAGAATVDAGAGVPVMNYAVNADPLQQTDLLTATPVTDMVPPAAVPVVFEHALTQVYFSAYKSADILGDVRITSVTLGDVYSSGSTPMSIPAQWSGQSGPTGYTVDIAGGGLRGDRLLTTAPQEITSLAGRMLLMPQALDGGNNPRLTVEFLVGTTAMDYTLDLTAPSGGWGAGRSVNYQLSVDGSTVTAIAVDNAITLNPWTAFTVKESVTLASDPTKNINSYNFALTTLNTVNGLFSECEWFGIYAVSDVTGDIAIDLGTAALGNFAAGERLIFDFHTTAGVWGTNPGGDPWTVSVTNIDGWQSTDAAKSVDAITGATLTRGNATTITQKGSIILQKL